MRLLPCFSLLLKFSCSLLNAPDPLQFILFQAWRRIIEEFVWKGSSKVIQSNTPATSRDIFHQIRWLRTPSNLTVHISRDGALIIPVGNLFQFITTLIVKNLFLISSLTQPSLGLEPLSLTLQQQQALLKILSSSFLQAPSSTGRLQQGLPLYNMSVMVNMMHDYSALFFPGTDLIMKTTSYCFMMTLENENIMARVVSHVRL